MFFFHVLALAIKIVTFFGPIKHIKIELKLTEMLLVIGPIGGY